MGELPVRSAIAVLAALARESRNPKRPLRDRKFIWVDSENFDDFLSRLEPELQLRVPDLITGQGEIFVQLRFKALDDFAPEAVAEQVDVLRKLLDQRCHLVDLTLYAGVSRDRDRSFAEVARKPGGFTALADKLEAWEEVSVDRTHAPIDPDVMAREVGGWRLVRSNDEGLYLRDALRTLGRWVDRDRDVVFESGVDAIEATIDAIDGMVSRQLGSIFRHEEFRALESTWRGLRELVGRVSTSQVRVYVLDVSKEELGGDSGYDKGDRSRVEESRWDWLHGSLVNAFWEVRRLCLVAACPFSHSEEDVALLHRLAETAEKLGLPLVTGVSPRLFGLEAWEEFEGSVVAERFAQPEYADWHALLRAQDARSLVLALPEFVPRGRFRKQHGVRACFEFEEYVGEVPREFELRASPAFIVAAALARAVAQGALPDPRTDPVEVGLDLRAEGAPLGPLRSRLDDAMNAVLRAHGLTSLSSNQVALLLETSTAVGADGS
jgi:type VI secretion system protein ImpC